jgi:hypothetical protein
MATQDIAGSSPAQRPAFTHEASVAALNPETPAADDTRARRPACADDRNRGRKRAHTGPGVDRLLIVLSVAERTPSPHRDAHPCTRAL